MVIKKFDDYFRLNENHFEDDKIIDKTIAQYLFDIEEGNLAPTEEISDEDYDYFMKEVVGMSFSEYAKFIFPDEPETILDDIGNNSEIMNYLKEKYPLVYKSYLANIKRKDFNL